MSFKILFLIKNSYKNFFYSIKMLMCAYRIQKNCYERIELQNVRDCNSVISTLGHMMGYRFQVGTNAS